MSVFIFIILLFLLLFIGVPIGFVLLIVGSLGLWYLNGIDAVLSLLASTPYRSVNSFTYSAIPLFILMAHFISKSKIADDLFKSLRNWIGHYPGGIGVATVFSSAGFGTMTGSSYAATTIMSRICIPQLMKVKYSDSFSAGLVATTTGTLAVLIPPSIPLVIYGIQTDTSIGKLLIAGILPGIIIVTLLSVYVVCIALKNKSTLEKVSWSERFSSLKSVWPIMILIFLVIFIIYAGIGTSTEAAAFGSFGALIIGLVMKRLKFKDIMESLIETVKQTAMIFFIVMGAYIFSYFITITRLGNKLVGIIETSGLSGFSIILLIILLYLILGMFLDMLSSMLLTLPIVLPVITQIGYDPIWFGVIVVLILEIGLVTPPVGMNLFITSSNSGVPVQKVLAGSLPFIFLLLFSTLLFIIFPEIILYLPSKM